MTNQLSPVYDDRAAMHQYDRCNCGRVKAKQARRCKVCWDLERRKRDRLRELRRLPRTKGTPHGIG